MTVNDAHVGVVAAEDVVEVADGHRATAKAVTDQMMHEMIQIKSLIRTVQKVAVADRIHEAADVVMAVAVVTGKGMVEEVITDAVEADRVMVAVATVSAGRDRVDQTQIEMTDKITKVDDAVDPVTLAEMIMLNPEKTNQKLRPR